MFTGRPERLAGYSYLGFQRYFLTFCTFERRPHFTCAEHVACAADQIVRAAEHEQFAVAAYCFMPDHLHLLVEGQTEAADGRRFMTRAKQLSGFAFATSTGERLWQRYGYERVLRGEDDTRAVIRYILENPVRAGLVTHPSSYPFSGSDRYSMAEILQAAAWTPFGQ